MRWTALTAAVTVLIAVPRLKGRAKAWSLSPHSLAPTAALAGLI